MSTCCRGGSGGIGGTSSQGGPPTQPRGIPIVIQTRAASIETARRERANAAAELFARYQSTRDPAVRADIVERHLVLADLVAHDYEGRGVERDDLCQIALVGLVEAVDRFDPSKGTAFATFASVTMNGRIKRYFRDASWDIRPPRRLQDLHRRVGRASSELSHRLGRAPSVDEVADHLGVSADHVLEAFAASTAYRADRLDRQLTTDDGTVVALDRLADDDDAIARADARETIRQLLDALPPVHADIVRLRYWDDLNQCEIAARLDMTQGHVSRVLRTCLPKMRQRMERARRAAA